MTSNQIELMAKNLGLIPKGNPKSGKGSYIDPVTGKQRILIHPDPKQGQPHCHVNSADGERLSINGNVISPEAPEAHLPLKVEIE